MKLLQKYGPLPEELCRVYFAELVVIIGIFTLHSLIQITNANCEKYISYYDIPQIFVHKK